MDLTIEVLRLAQKGEKEAQNQLMLGLYAPVYHFIHNRVHLRESADELCQTVFLKCYEHLDTYKSQQGGIKTWVFKIARNTLIDYYRKSKSDPVDDLRDVPADDIASHTMAYTSARIDREYVTRLLFELESVEADVITLRAIDEMAYTDIAAIIDKSEEATRQIYSRGLTKLKKLVNGTEKYTNPYV